MAQQQILELRHSLGTQRLWVGQILQKVVGILAYVREVPRHLVRVVDSYVCRNVEFETLVPAFDVAGVRNIQFLQGEFHCRICSRRQL